MVIGTLTFPTPTPLQVRSLWNKSWIGGLLTLIIFDPKTAIFGKIPIAKDWGRLMKERKGS